MKRLSVFCPGLMAALVAAFLVHCGGEHRPLAPTNLPSSDKPAEKALGPGAALIDIGIGGIGIGGGSGERVLIGFRQAPDPSLIQSLGGIVTRTYQLVPAVAASVTPEVRLLIAAQPSVAYVEEDKEVRASAVTVAQAGDPYGAEADRSWGVAQIGAAREHERGNTGRGVRVGIVDSGMDYTHPDLRDNYAGGYDFVNNDPDPMDDLGHGTFVAGTLGAKRDGAGAVGVAPEARLYALKILNAAGRGFVSDAIAALQWCRDNNIQITNHSYEATEDLGTTFENAFERSASAGATHFAAAGNSGGSDDGRSRVTYPARYLAVAAVGATDRSDQRIWFSSTGPEVELAAPGAGAYTPMMGGGYGYPSGTSMACPHAAGAAALIIAAGGINPRGTLGTTAKDMGPQGRDQEYGYGVIRVGEEAGPPPPPPPPPPPGVTVIWDGEGNQVAGTRFHYGNANSSDAYEGQWCFEAKPTKWHEPGIGLNGTETWRADISGFQEITFYAKSDMRGRTFEFSIYGWPYRSNRVNIDPYIEGGGGLDTGYKLVRIPISDLKTSNYPLDRVEILYFGVAQPTAGHRIFIDNIHVR